MSSPDEFYRLDKYADEENVCNEQIIAEAIEMNRNEMKANEDLIEYLRSKLTPRWTDTICTPNQLTMRIGIVFLVGCLAGTLAAVIASAIFVIVVSH